MISFEDAPCRQTDPEAMFPYGAADTRRAKKICEGCDPELRAACLEIAIAGHEYGVWAGTTDADRRKIRAQRRSA